MENSTRNSFVFYDSFYNALSMIKDNDIKAQAYDIIVGYALYGKKPKTNEMILKIIFEMVKPIIENSGKRYNASIENGKKGGAPKGNKNAVKEQNDMQNGGENVINNTENNNFGSNSKRSGKNAEKHIICADESTTTMDSDLSNDNTMPNIDGTNATQEDLTLTKNIENDEERRATAYEKFLINKARYEEKKNNTDVAGGAYTNSCKLSTEDFEKFAEIFPTKKILSSQKLPPTFNMDKLIEAVQNSKFLSNNDNLDFAWLVTRYDYVIGGKYKDFTNTKVVATNNGNVIITHDYSEEELNDMFTDLDSIDI